MIVSLWSGPRNCSTALMYSMAQRSDVRVVDEPLFAHFLKLTGAKRPSREEVLASMPSDFVEIASGWTDFVEKHIFLKHMGNHLEGTDPAAFSNHFHVFLVRDPGKVLSSYRQHIERPTRLDLCYDHQMQWLQHCRQNEMPYAIIDSDKLVSNPRGQLILLCDRLGWDFDESMMRWKPGPRPEDGPWAKYWYHRVHQSSGWEPVEPKAINPQLPEELEALRIEITPIFETLRSYAL